MKKLITIHDQSNLEMISKYVDGIIIGNDLFATRLTKSFSNKEIISLTARIKELHKEVFLMANQMMTDSDLEGFSLFLDLIKIEDFTGIIVADLGAMVLLKEKGLGKKAIYNPETLATNFYDFNFLHQLDALGVYAAKEITLDDLKTIGKHKEMKMFMVGHGHLNMFYSKRQLIKNYQDFLGEDMQLHLRQDLKIIEEKRPLEPYPILEDDAGTHVFRSHVMNAFDYMDDLCEVLDYFVIDTIFKDDRYGALVSQMYHENDNQIKNQIINEYHEVWDEGFFFKKTIYKNKGGEQ